MQNFSKTAKKNMIARVNNSSKSVGLNQYIRMENRYPGFYEGFRVTDCLTFVWRVLTETYKELGRPDIPKALLPHIRVARWGRTSKDMYGDLLAKALVSQQGWKAVYLTPDSVHPNDGELKHFENAQRVMDSCFHSHIPVSYYGFNYRPTEKTGEFYGAVNKGAGPTEFNEAAAKALMDVPFGFGISSKGDHTWLFSEGKVFEVHWDNEAPYVYEVKWLRGFEWNSNLLVVPPDGLKQLNNKGFNKCG